MSQDSKKLLEQALELSSRERGQLAATLIESLDTDFDEDAHLKWSQEIERRLADIDNNNVELIAWSEVRRKMQISNDLAD